MAVSTPLADSSNVISRSYRRSLPRSGPPRRPPPKKSPKMPPKMSSNPANVDGSNPAPACDETPRGRTGRTWRAFAIRQNRVSLGGLLESLFGLFVPLVPIRMMFEGELAIGALDLLVAGGLGNAENLVVIPFAHAFATFTMAGRTSLSPSR